MRRAALIILALALLAPLLAPAPAAAAPTTQAYNPCAVAVNAALGKIGAPYVWGAKGPGSFDCSGLTYWAYQQAGINIGLSTYDQQAAGVSIPCTLADLAGAASTCWQPGDLAFLHYPGGQHVALYAGNGLFVDAYNRDTGVILHNPAADDYYWSHWWQARRPTSCAGVTIDPGTPTPIPSGISPDLEAIADILAPISLQLPWSCGSCAPGVADLGELEYPPASFNPLYPFQWAGVFAWNELFRPLICWLLAIAQALLNALAYAFNSVLVAGVNLIWRLGVLGLLWFRDSFLALWGVVAWARSLAWEWYGAALQLADQVRRLGLVVEGLGALFNQLLSDIGRIAMQVIQVIWYFVGLFMTLIPGMVTAIFAPVAPPQFAEIQTFFLFQWLIDMFRALADSKLWWAWLSFVGIIYLRFILWLLDELATLNQ